MLNLLPGMGGLIHLKATRVSDVVPSPKSLWYTDVPLGPNMVCVFIWTYMGMCLYLDHIWLSAYIWVFMGMCLYLNHVRACAFVWTIYGHVPLFGPYMGMCLYLETMISVQEL